MVQSSMNRWETGTPVMAFSIRPSQMLLGRKWGTEPFTMTRNVVMARTVGDVTYIVNINNFLPIFFLWDCCVVEPQS